MKPSDPVGTDKLCFLHMLFRAIGPDGEEGARDGIERLTGARSCKGLDEGQAWAIIDGLCQSLGRPNLSPICVAWAPVYTRSRVPIGGTDVTRPPSQAQIWALHRKFREGGVADPKAFLAWKFELKDGVIRTAQQAWRVSKSARRIQEGAPRPPRMERHGRQKEN